MFRITLSLPTSVNALYANAGGGRRRLSDEAKAWKEEAGLQIKAAANRTAYTHPAGARSILLFEVWFGKDLKRDVSNVVKVAEDTLATALGFNDNTVIASLPLLRGIDTFQPRVEITLIPVVGEWQAITSAIATGVVRVAAGEAVW